MFYNAAVERDVADPKGYDMLFVDGMVKGSLLTRASHSCEPNAEMRVRVREGSYAVEMVSTCHIARGEEVCWDYNCQTDSEREMKRAICCCGAKRCRVSYLHYAGDDDFASYLRARQHVAVTTAALLRASCTSTSRPPPSSSSSITMSDVIRQLSDAGLKLGDASDDTERGVLSGLPEWTLRFAASAVKYIADEKAALRVTLASQALVKAAKARAAAAKDGGAGGGDGSAAAAAAAKAAKAAHLDAESEASGVAAGRLQSLVVTLDKVRHVLSTDAAGGTDPVRGMANEKMVADGVRAAPPPLKALTAAHALTHLNAVMKRALKAAKETLGDRAFKKLEDAAGDGGKASASLKDARRRLRAVAAAAWRLKESESESDDDDDDDAHAAAAATGDLLYLTSITRTFFRPSALTMPFTSPFCQVGSVGGGAGVVHRMRYGATAVYAFLATWHAEYLESAESVVWRRAQGGVCLPIPAAPLEAHGAKGGGGGGGDRTGGAPPQKRRKSSRDGDDDDDEAPPVRGAVGAQPSSFLATQLTRGGGKPWCRVDGWKYVGMDEDAVLGSPVMDAILTGGDSAPGAAALAALTAAKRDALTAHEKTFVVEAFDHDDEVFVPCWNEADVPVVVAPAVRVPAAAAPAPAPAPPAKDGFAEPESRAAAIKNENDVAAPAEDSPAVAALAKSTSEAAAEAAKNDSKPPPAPAPLAGDPVPLKENNVRCVVCARVGVDARDFILCDGCPAGGHLACLRIDPPPPPPNASWCCHACRGGKLAGIAPPGRRGFLLAAAEAAANGTLGRMQRGAGSGVGAGGAHGAGMSVSLAPGAIGPPPPSGAIARANLARGFKGFGVELLSKGFRSASPPPPSGGKGGDGALTESGANKRSFDDLAGMAKMDDDYGGGGGGGPPCRRVLLTLVPIRPCSRGERHSLRTLPGVSLCPALGFNPRPRSLSTPSDAFQLHPDAVQFPRPSDVPARRRRRLRRREGRVRHRRRARALSLLRVRRGRRREAAGE